MAGSRLEKLGSIFSRVQGLLRSGALKYEDRPLWYDIYKRFPPKLNPVFEREVSKTPVPALLYREDFVRARFFNEFGHKHDLVNLTDDNKTQLVCERFIQKYNQIKTDKITEDIAFIGARDALRAEGVSLKTLEEIAADESDKMKNELKKAVQHSDVKSATTKGTFAAKDLFGDTAVKKTSEEDEAFLDREFFDTEAEELLKESQAQSQSADFQTHSKRSKHKPS